MDTKKISVIIPIFNVEQHIKKVAESLKQQYFTGLEIILVDDGSTDKSIETATKILHGLDVTVLTQKNTGPGGARNNGIKAANGEYLMFIDSDDFILDNALSNIIHLIKTQNPDIIFGRYLRWISDTGLILDKTDKLDENMNENETETETETEKSHKNAAITIEHILTVFPELSWNSAWRYICKRSFILQNNLFFNDTMYCEDMKWVLELLAAAEQKKAKFAFLQQPFYVYNYRRPDSIMNAHSPKRLLDLNIIMAEFLQIHQNRPAICRELVWQSFYYINEYCQFSKPERQQIYDHYKKVLPLYKLSKSPFYSLVGRLNTPFLFYVLSWVLSTIKNARRAVLYRGKKND
ncbi:MAG: glycosyltransferase [Defluviitaleaceae bacterium]|nr:glycosyltransferase [Defluviitaleaceae bacterium]